MNRWQCKLRRIWWWLWGGVGDGHTYLDEEVHHNKTVVLGRCTVCGKRDVMWGERADFELTKQHHE
jgi:hypothetical protein